jgi:NADH:quinone reductase (non-electrogenic)
VAIVGGGAPAPNWPPSCTAPTRKVVAYGLDRIDPQRDIRIVLIEAAQRILPGLPERISEATHRLLDQIGIDVRTGAKVTKASAEGLTLADGSFITSELVVWAAGVKAPEVLGWLDGLETNRINQLLVKSTLQTTRDPVICPRGPGNPRAAGAGRASGSGAYGPPG